MNFLSLYTNLLPRARAWTITITKPLRSLFVGLDLSATKTFVDLIWLDIFPDTTRELEKWEDQWYLRSGNFTEQERRDRLDAAWKALGGQDPRYIQDTLQANGFDVFIHEWWVPGTEAPIGVRACAEARSPFEFLRETNIQPDPFTGCGEVIMECGEVVALCGNSLQPPGYALVNKIAGREYTIPADDSKWPYFLYIGGENFPDLAVIDPARQDEFEDLCLKICPTQQWLGILVSYA